MFSRRVFLRNGALAVVGTAAVPAFLTRAAFSAVGAGAGNKRLVVIFQRGAADGLNIVVPHGDSAYYAMRPSINIPRSAVLDLDVLRLAPAGAPSSPLNQRHLASCTQPVLPIPPFPLRCTHFMESKRLASNEDGWLNRTLHARLHH
jgi:uncharacterized protein (DUF1501 family)